MVGVPLLGVVAGCSDRGIELELHIPNEPEQNLHLEIQIDTKSGISPRKVSRGVYAIDLNESGYAVIDSAVVLEEWRKTYLITPTRKLIRNEGYVLRDSGWNMAVVTEKLPGGGVRSTSTMDGSTYWMDIEIPGARPK
jgi:hypothetical protein